MADIDYSQYGAVPEKNTIDYSQYDVSPENTEKQDNLPPYERFLASQPENPMQSLEPFGGGGEAGRNAAITGAALAFPQVRAAKYIPQAGNLLKYLTNTLGYTAQSGALGGTINALEGGSFKEGAKTGALIGGGIGAVVPPAAKIYNALRPSNLLKGNASSEELARNLEATQGTKTSLGDVVSNPLMKQFYENFLAKLPFSGAHQNLAETASGIVNRGQNMVDRFLPEGVAPGQVSEHLGEALINSKKSASQAKIKAYETANNLAERDNLKLELPNFSKLANEYIDSIENTTMLQHEPEAKALLNKLKNYKNPTKKITTEGKIVDKEGMSLSSETSVQYPSLREANILAGKLNDIADRFKSSLNASDRGAATILGNLGRTLKSDIRGAINQNGSSQLQKEFNKAEKNYKENYHPFLDKDLLKFTEKGHPPEDLIAMFLKNSKISDKSQQLNKLMSKLSQPEQDLVRYGYFSRAMKGPEDARIVDPNSLRMLWKNLGQNQKKVLITNPLERRAFDNFANLTEKNQEALSLMSNPKTGHRGLIDYMWKAPIGVILRPAVNKLSSEEFRNKIVKKMISSQKKER